MISDLLLWAVYRSLDSATGSRALHGRRSAGEVLADWCRRQLSDIELMEAITESYAANRSMRQDGEPRVVLHPKLKRKQGKTERKEPALWVDWNAEAPDLKRRNKPNLRGKELVAAVRELMSMLVPPPLPRRWTP